MKKLLENTLSGNDRSIGEVLYIGAGTGSALGDLVDFHPDKIIAVESSNTLTKALQKRAKKYGNVIVINEWVLPSNEKSTEISLYNNPRYNSIYSLENEKSQSNLKLLEKRNVKGINITGILEQYPVPKEKLNLLILSFSGASQFILQEKCSQATESFDYLIVIDSSAKVTSLDKSQALPKDRFIRLPVIDSCSSFNEVYFINRPYIDALNVISKTKQELEVQTKALILAKHESEKTIEALSNERDGLKKGCEESNDICEKLKSEIAKLKSDIEELSQAVAKHENHNSELKSQCDELERERKKIVAGTEKAESLSILHLKLLSKAQANEDELRAQLADKNKEINELRGLISELSEKLNQASHIYKQLLERHPDLELESF